MKQIKFYKIPKSNARNGVYHYITSRPWNKVITRNVPDDMKFTELCQYWQVVENFDEAEVLTVWHVYDPNEENGCQDCYYCELKEGYTEWDTRRIDRMMNGE